MTKRYQTSSRNFARKVRLGLVLSVSALVSLSAVGCSAAAENPPADGESSQATGLLAEIQDRGYITVGTTGDNRPTIFKEGEELVGLDADWAQIIADALDVEVEWEIVQFSALVPGIEAGKFDIALSGINVTDARKEVINFSTPYAEDAVIAVFKKDGPIKATDTPEEALNGRSACVVAGSANGDVPATELGTSSDIQRYTGGIAVIMQALQDGRCDMAMTTRIAADTYISSDAGEGLARSDSALSTVPIAVAISKTDTEDLIDAINSAMSAAKQDGICQELAVKWIGTEFPPSVCK